MAVTTSIDPQARALLDQLAAAGGPPLETLPVEEARAAVMGLRELAGPPRPVASVEDRTVPGPAGAIPVRIYTPEGDGPFPVLVYFHGGCWFMGNVEFLDTPCRALANAAGCIVVSVDYRLAPEHKFPAAAEDCYAATRYLAEHAAEIGGDPARIAVGGDSAGGNLAAVVALMARDRGAPALAYQLLVYPITNHAFDTASYRESGEGFLLTRSLMEWGWRHYLRNDADGRNPYASPLRADDLRGLPPACVITAEFDPLRDEGQAYATRLREAGVPVEAQHYAGMIHGFWQLGGAIEEGRRVIEDAGAALRAAFATSRPASGGADTAERAIGHSIDEVSGSGRGGTRSPR